MPHSPQTRRPHPKAHTDADTTRSLANEQLHEATEIVRELVPGAEQVVLADPDEPYEPGALRLRHVLDAHGAVLYTAGQHDPLADLIETHLIDVRDTDPDTSARLCSTAATTGERDQSGWSSPADVLRQTYDRNQRTPRPGTNPRPTPRDHRQRPRAHAANARHHSSIDLG